MKQAIATSNFCVHEFRSSILITIKNQNWQEAINLCLNWLEKEPESAEAYKLLGNVYERSQQKKWAEICYRRAIKYQVNYAEAYVDLGNIEAQKNNFRAAIYLIQKAIVIKPNFAGAYRNLARCWEQVGDRMAALDCSYEALRLEPEAIALETHQNIAEQLLKLEQWTKAIVCLQRLPQRNSELAEFAYSKMSLAFRALGKLKEAQLCDQVAQQGSVEKTLISRDSRTGMFRERQSPQTSETGSRNGRNALEFTSASDPIELDTQIHLTQLYCDRKQWARAIQLCQALLTKPLATSSQAEIYKCLGTALWATGDRDRAAGVYREALRRKPQFPEVLANLGSVYTQQGKVPEAIACYQRAIRMKPDFAGAHRNFAKLWQQVGEERQALKHWSRALNLEPTGATAAEQVVLGNRWARLGNLAEAERLYRRAINFEPTLSHAWHNLGEVLGARERWGEAVLAHQRAIALDAKSVKFYQGIAKAFAAQKRWREVEAAYRQAVKLAPQSDELYHRWGDALAKLQRWEEAAAAYRQAIALNGDRIWSYNNLGEALMQQSRWLEAANAYRIATRRQPDFVWAFYNFGDALAQLHEWDEAVMAYRAAIALQDDLPDIELKLARAYRARIEFDRDAADHWYAKAIEKARDSVAQEELQLESSSEESEATDLVNAIDDQRESKLSTSSQAVTTDPAAESANAEFERGKDYLESGQVDRAKASFQAAIAIDPQCAWAHHYLGDILRQEGNCEVALTSYDRAIEFGAPPSFWSYYNRAQLQVEQGNREAAIASYRAAIAIDPNYSWAHKHLGDLLASEGDTDAASCAYRRAVACTPKIY